MIWIVDFGSQYTQLITRKIRELGHQSEIITVEESLNRLQKENPDALILSGGPQSVFHDQTDYSLFFKNPDLPILGICYGMQLIGQYFGGVVEKGIKGEYGLSSVFAQKKLGHIPQEQKVWMSHADHISKVPQHFEIIFKSENNLLAGIKHLSRPILALQFHPEVHHSREGLKTLKYFIEDIAHLKSDWTNTKIKESSLEVIHKIGKKNVLCAFSGGVDSLVAASLAHELLGHQLHCFFVDNGLLRPQDLSHIHLLQEKTPLKIQIIHAKDLFLNALKGISDPETKRKIIGKIFIEVFESKVHEYESKHQIKFDYLLQGTLYPDVIESLSPHKKDGKSQTIKSHHNVGGLPERMNLKLLEPLRFLFKDEVRLLGKELGLPDEWLFRHPFPGPGIGVRVLGEISEASVLKVQLSDQILFEELHRDHLYNSTWQAFTVLLPVKTVGVKGDGRVYEEVIALRMVNSVDGMTADVTELPWSFLSKVATRICNEVSGITRVVYDLTSKPPGTIEWE
jgi:GMP synthase (glutamine-hydrolysing)